MGTRKYQAGYPWWPQFTAPSQKRKSHEPFQYIYIRERRLFCFLFLCRFNTGTDSAKITVWLCHIVWTAIQLKALAATIVMKSLNKNKLALHGLLQVSGSTQQIDTLYYKNNLNETTYVQRGLGAPPDWHHEHQTDPCMNSTEKLNLLLRWCCRAKKLVWSSHPKLTWNNGVRHPQSQTVKRDLADCPHSPGTH